MRHLFLIADMVPPAAPGDNAHAWLVLVFIVSVAVALWVYQRLEVDRDAD